MPAHISEFAQLHLSAQHTYRTISVSRPVPSIVTGPSIAAPVYVALSSYRRSEEGNSNESNGGGDYSHDDLCEGLVVACETIRLEVAEVSLFKGEVGGTETCTQRVGGTAIVPSPEAEFIHEDSAP